MVSIRNVIEHKVVYRADMKQRMKIRDLKECWEKAGGKSMCPDFMYVDSTFSLLKHKLFSITFYIHRWLNSHCLFYVLCPFRKQVILALHFSLSFIAHNTFCPFATSIPPSTWSSSLGMSGAAFPCPFFPLFTLRVSDSSSPPFLLRVPETSVASC